MKTLRTLFIHCLAIVLSFASIIPALAAEEETLYYDYTLMDAFFLSTSARTGVLDYSPIDDNVDTVSLTGNIASGTAVASGTTITGEIRLAAVDSNSQGTANFTLTLKKNDIPIGDTTIAVPESASDLTYETYTISFATTNSFTAADTLIWNIATSDAVSGTEDRGMQLDPDHSFLVFPKEFPWTMFLPAILGKSLAAQ